MTSSCRHDYIIIWTMAMLGLSLDIPEGYGSVKYVDPAANGDIKQCTIDILWVIHVYYRIYQILISCTLRPKQIGQYFQSIFTYVFQSLHLDPAFIMLQTVCLTISHWRGHGLRGKTRIFNHILDKIYFIWFEIYWSYKILAPIWQYDSNTLGNRLAPDCWTFISYTIMVRLWPMSQRCVTIGEHLKIQTSLTRWALLYHLISLANLLYV